MARPAHTSIEGSPEAWDAAVDDNFGLVFTTPMPPARYADVGSLPAAASYDGCVADVTGDGFYRSNGTTWDRIASYGGSVADPTGWADSTAQAWALDLVTKLKASGVID